MFARRVDGTHKEVTEALRQCGWDVLDTSRLRGFVDLVAYHPGRQALRLIEVKTANGKPTVFQQRLLERKWPIAVVRSAEDAINL